jgi:hypothetical protein
MCTISYLTAPDALPEILVENLGYIPAVVLRSGAISEHL